MNQPNPFQAPQVIIDTPQVQARSASAEGIWSDGKLLVVSKMARLPGICVLTNRKPKRFIKRTYYWHHPAVSFSLLAGLLIYLILALVLRKSIKLDLPLSEASLQKRKKALTLCWIVGLTCVAIIVGGILGAATEAFGYDNGWIGGLIALGGFIGLLISAIVGSRKAAILVPKRITAHAGWFKGASPEYLKRFPALPANMK